VQGCLPGPTIKNNRLPDKILVARPAQPSRPGDVDAYRDTKKFWDFELIDKIVMKYMYTHTTSISLNVLGRIKL
jgi:hypothetical protein